MDWPGVQRWCGINMINSSLALVFPGQGSQQVGMLADIAEQYPQINATLAEASDVLGYDMQQLIYAGPAEQLNMTVHTQPALLAASYALWRVLTQDNQWHPAMLAGHSLGEYTALVCAEALTFPDALRLVSARGQFMQEAVTEGVGAMAAVIGLEDAVVSALCDDVRQANEVLAPANFNSVGQVVIAGHAAAVERALIVAKEKGARMAVSIPVSVPSHCELMRPAAERLQDLLQIIHIATPALPVFSNADVDIYRDAAQIRAGLVKQLYSPVRWVETIQAMMQQGITRIVECGPGKVLTGLNKRIDKSLTLQAMGDLDSLSTIINEGSL